MGTLKVLVAGFWAVVLLFGPEPVCTAEHPGEPGAHEAPPAHQHRQVDFPPVMPNTTGPIVTDPAITQATGTGTLQITAFPAFVGGNFSPAWRRVSAGGNYKFLSVPVQLIYGPWPRTEVQFLAPYLENWASDVGAHNRAANFGGIGDSIFIFKYLLVHEGPNHPTITVYSAAGFPTGHHHHLNPNLLGIDQLGLGAYSLTVGLDLFKYVKPFLVYANIWHTNCLNGEVNGAQVYYPDQVTVNLAIEMPFQNSPSNRWALLFELLSTWDAGRMFGPPANQASSAVVSVLPALEFLPTSWVQLAAGIQVTLVGKNSLYSYTPTLAVFFNF